MKAGDKHKVETLRGVSSDLKYRKIELGKELPDDEVESVLRKAAKRRRESIALYTEGGREDLRSQEQRELEMIQAYLPPEMSDDSLDQLLHAAIAEAEVTQPGDVGRVMKLVMPRLKGQASGERVRSRATALLTSSH